MKSTRNSPSSIKKKPKSKFIVRLKKMSDRLKLKRVKEKIESSYNSDNNLFI